MSSRHELRPNTCLPSEAIRSAHETFSGWMFGSALPLWMTAGQDRRGLGFIEHMTLDGKPAEVPYKRMRVQTRQTYVFSHAAVMGWPGGLAAARNGYTFFTREGELPGGGYARVLGRDGGVIDPAVHLYENAFVLFALAWFARAAGDSQAIERAHRLLDWIDCRMVAAGAVGGFENAVPAVAGPREQNPHMHLLEALLALYETTGERRFADSARKILDLFRSRLFDPGTGTLVEFYAPDWSRLGSAEGRRVDPGHHYEWVWLLSECSRLLGEETARERMALYVFAEKHGRAADERLVVDAVDATGMPVDRSVRVWPQTEAIKAHVAMLDIVGEAAESRLVETTDRLMSVFLNRRPPGTWTEHFWPDGSVRADKVPATTLYHLLMALAELDRVARPLPRALSGRPATIRAGP